MKTKVKNKYSKKKARRHIKNAEYYNDSANHNSRYAQKKARQAKGNYSADSPLRCIENANS